MQAEQANICNVVQRQVVSPWRSQAVRLPAAVRAKPVSTLLRAAFLSWRYGVMHSAAHDWRRLLKAPPYPGRPAGSLHASVLPRLEPALTVQFPPRASARQRLWTCAMLKLWIWGVAHAL